MFESYFRKEIPWGGKTLVLETGKIARQADGAVMARLGDTIVLCTADPPAVPGWIPQRGPGGRDRAVA